VVTGYQQLDETMIVLDCRVSFCGYDLIWKIAYYYHIVTIKKPVKINIFLNTQYQWQEKYCIYYFNVSIYTVLPAQ